MNELISLAREYLYTHVEDVSSIPENIGINPVFNENREFKVHGDFPKEARHQLAAPRKGVSVVPSDDLYSHIKSTFDDITDGFSVEGVESVDIGIRETYETSGRSSSVNYTPNEADVQIELDIQTKTIPEPLKNQLFSLIANTTHEWDPQISKQNIVNSDIIFSNEIPCEVATIRGSVVTSRPHLRFGLSSVEEYVTITTTNTHEYDKNVDKDNYKIRYSVRDKYLQTSSTIQVTAQKIMNTVVQNTIDIQWENYILESEGIFAGQLENRPHEDSVKYVLVIPVVGDKIGITK